MMSSSVPVSVHDDVIFSRVKDRLSKNCKGKPFAPCKLSLRRSMLVNLAYLKVSFFPSEDRARLSQLQKYHTSIPLWDELAVKKCSNAALYEFLSDLNFWGTDSRGSSTDMDGISKEYFLTYFEIVSWYTDNETAFEKNLSHIFVITPDDILNYIIKKRVTVDTPERDENHGIAFRRAISMKVISLSRSLPTSNNIKNDSMRNDSMRNENIRDDYVKSPHILIPSNVNENQSKLTHSPRPPMTHFSTTNFSFSRPTSSSSRRGSDTSNSGTGSGSREKGSSGRYNYENGSISSCQGLTSVGNGSSSGVGSSSSGSGSGSKTGSSGGSSSSGRRRSNYIIPSSPCDINLKIYKSPNRIRRLSSSDIDIRAGMMGTSEETERNDNNQGDNVENNQQNNQEYDQETEINKNNLRKCNLESTIQKKNNFEKEKTMPIERKIDFTRGKSCDLKINKRIVLSINSLNERKIDQINGNNAIENNKNRVKNHYINKSKQDSFSKHSSGNQILEVLRAKKIPGNIPPTTISEPSPQQSTSKIIIMNKNGLDNVNKMHETEICLRAVNRNEFLEDSQINDIIAAKNINDDEIISKNKIDSSTAISGSNIQNSVLTIEEQFVKKKNARRKSIFYPNLFLGMNFSLLAAPETLTSTSTQLNPSVCQSTLLKDSDDSNNNDNSNNDDNNNNNNNNNNNDNNNNNSDNNNDDDNNDNNNNYHGNNNNNEIINSIIKRHKQELEKINNQNFLIKKENVTLKRKLELMRKKMKNMMIEERNKSLPTHALHKHNHHHSTMPDNSIDKDIDNDFI